jgi:hypothetical protein
MSDLGLQPKEVQHQSHRLPAEKKLGVRRHEQATAFSFLSQALALFVNMPLV